MAGMVQILFHVHGRIAERRTRLAAGQIQVVSSAASLWTTCMPRPPPPPAALMMMG